MKYLFVIIIVLMQFALAQNPPHWIIYNTSNSLLPSNDVDHIVVDNINRKWLSCWYYGMLMIENENWILYDTTNSDIPSNILSSINVDENLNFWAGGYNDIGNFRLTKFDGNIWTIWNSSNSPIPKDNIMAIIFDSQGDLWLICKDADYPSEINYILELTQDSIWISHASFRTFNGFRQMLFDEDQILWIDVWNGLYKYDGNNLTFIPAGSIGQYVTEIKKDSLGNIWIATGIAGWGGLIKYNGISFTSNYNIKAISIEVDAEGNIWVGTESFSYQAELLKYNGSSWITYNSTNSQLPATYRINDLAFDVFGNLWIATDDAGLVVFNENGIIVPVELKNFRAELVERDAHLNWSTATETNNQGFEIERASSNQEWQSIGFVEGNGTTTETQYYSFTDESLQSWKYQYRLKQIDFDGSFEYSNIIEVEVGLPEEFSLSQNYPNPFNSSTTISYGLPEGTFVSLIVYDCLGNNVRSLVNEFQEAGLHIVVFDSNNLPSGLYFLRMLASDWDQTRKMVLLK